MDILHITLSEFKSHTFILLIDPQNQYLVGDCPSIYKQICNLPFKQPLNPFETYLKTRMKSRDGFKVVTKALQFLVDGERMIVNKCEEANVHPKLEWVIHFLLGKDYH